MQLPPCSQSPIGPRFPFLFQLGSAPSLKIPLMGSWVKICSERFFQHKLVSIFHSPGFGEHFDNDTTI